MLMIKSAIKLRQIISYNSVELCSGNPIFVSHTLEINKRNKYLVVIKPILMGVCRSDLKEMLGERSSRHDFGHEVLGKVYWAGKKVPLSQGNIVTFNPNINISRNSGFSEFLIASGSTRELKEAFPLVESGETEYLRKLVFCEPMSCAQHCVASLLKYLCKSRLDGLSVGIVGAGMAGTLIGLIVKYMGAKITLFNRTEDKLEFLVKNNIFSMNELQLLGKTSIDKFDVIIPTTTFLYQPILRFSANAIKEDGLILLFGGTQEKDTFPGSTCNIDRIRRKEDIGKVQINKKSFNVGGTHGSILADYYQSVEMLIKHPDCFPVEHLIASEISLSQLPETLLHLGANNYFGKTVVKF